jgi:hypothetical protein
MVVISPLDFETDRGGHLIAMFVEPKPTAAHRASLV